MRGALAVAQATWRASRNHVVRGLGGRVPTVAVLVGVCAVVVLVNTGLYRFWSSQIGLILDSVEDAELADRLLSLLVQSSGMTAFAVALLFIALLPPRSRIALAATLAGAHRWTVVVGEVAPVAVVSAVLAVSVQIGTLVYLVSNSPHPSLGAPALVAYLAAMSGAALVTHLGGQSLGVLLRLGDVVGRMLGILVSTILLGLTAADLILAVDRQRETAVGTAWRAVWQAPVPGTGRALLGTLVVLVAAWSLLAVLCRFGAASSTLGGFRRLGSPARWGALPWYVAQPLRELWLWIRHPVTQVSLVLGAGMVALVSVGVRAGVLEPGMASLVLLVVFAASAETAHGRTAGWEWVYTSAGASPWRPLLARFGGLALVQYVLLVAALLVGVPSHLWGEALVAVSPVYLGMFGLAYLAGVAVPFSDSAPLGMFATSFLTLALEGALLWLELSVLGWEGAASLALNVVVCVACLVVSWAVMSARTRSRSRAASRTTVAATDAA